MTERTAAKGFHTHLTNQEARKEVRSDFCPSRRWHNLSSVINWQHRTVTERLQKNFASIPLGALSSPHKRQLCGRNIRNHTGNRRTQPKNCVFWFSAMRLARGHLIHAHTQLLLQWSRGKGASIVPDTAVLTGLSCAKFLFFPPSKKNPASSLPYRQLSHDTHQEECIK